MAFDFFTFMSSPEFRTVKELTTWAAGIYGANKAADYAEQVEKLNKAQIEAMDVNNLITWYNNRDKIIADRLEAVEAIQLKALNQEKIATAQDTANLQNAVYRKEIQIREQESLNEQYLKSEDIYNLQTTLNDVSEKQAVDSELRKLDEIRTEATFDMEEEALNQIAAEGQFRARGVSGRTADKARQMNVYDLGRMIAQVNEATSSAGRNTRAVLEEIKADKMSADLSAFAAKMLKPGVLPEIPMPSITPRQKLVEPRELGEFDFGPMPIPGLPFAPSGSAGKAWGQNVLNTTSTIQNIYEIWKDE